MIEHSLSALYDIAHGAGLSIVIPGWLRWRSKDETARINQLGSRIFDINPDEYSSGSSAIRRLEKWFARVKSPIRLAEAGIPESDIPKIAQNALGLARFWRLNQYDQATIEEILSLCR